MDSLTDPAALDGWIPYQLDWENPDPVVEWCYLGDARFTAPFSTQTIDDCLRRPFNLLFKHRTPIKTLRSFRAARPGLTPDGFIFHLSRSGSTLVSQMFAALPSNIVLSEAPIIDVAIRAYQYQPSASETERLEWLQQIVEILGRPRGEKHFILKFDAWSLLDWPIIRKAFPSVPWIFVYRDPVEVMVSQFNQRGAHTIPGVLPAALFGMDAQTAISVSPEEYCARILAKICEAALQYHQQGGLLINYSELPDVVWTRIVDFFKLRFSENELENLQAVARRDAKNPGTTFQSDTERKQQKANDAIRKAADKWLYPVYEKLETARRAQSIDVRS